MRLTYRPVHGWHAFAEEVGVVVLGVLLALAAQQAAGSLNERREASATRAALTNEIEETLAILKLRQAAQPCIDNRLGQLRGIIDEWGRTGSFDTPRWVSQATWFTVVTARFDAAESAGRLALLSSEEQYRFGLIVAGLRSFWEIESKEIETWSTLRILQSGPETLSATDRTEVRLALQRASSLNYLAKIKVGQTLDQAAGYGWRPDTNRLRQAMRLAWKNGKFVPTICLDIATPPDKANRASNMLYPLPE